jgi:bifunctional oligoribonuclease and PAP phosphatase NrnA
MNTYNDAAIKLEAAASVVIIQANNPDGDSLASAVALENILGEMGKTVQLYCGVDIPTYLRYIPGWDRVNKNFPAQFDLSIIVDTSSMDLFDSIIPGSWEFSALSKKPCIVFDHHKTPGNIPFDNTYVVQDAAATCEIIYDFATSQKWNIPTEGRKQLVMGILSDSLGLVTDSTTARTVRIVADIVESGIKLSEIDTARKALMKRHISLLEYKGRLLQRIQFSHNGMIAYVEIPWDEIQQYSPMYNPAMLIMEDLRMTEGVEVIIVFKKYPNNKLTAKIRTNPNFPIANQIAESYGGGGHEFASGFKVISKIPFQDTINSCLKTTSAIIADYEASPKSQTF